MKYMFITVHFSCEDVTTELTRKLLRIVGLIYIKLMKRNIRIGRNNSRDHTQSILE